MSVSSRQLAKARSEQPALLARAEMQSQCWICPHCFDDAHHYSEPAGCEREADSTGNRVRVGPTNI